MTTRKRLRPQPEHDSPLQQIVSSALEDMKAVNVKVLDVRGLTDIADTMIIASGNSDRHVRSIADNVVPEGQGGRVPAARDRGRARRRMGAGGSQDVLVHVMLPRVREFYGLENLWEAGVPVAAAAAKKPAAARATASRAAAARRRRVSR